MSEQLVCFGFESASVDPSKCRWKFFCGARDLEECVERVQHGAQVVMPLRKALPSDPLEDDVLEALKREVG